MNQTPSMANQNSVANSLVPQQNVGEEVTPTEPFNAYANPPSGRDLLVRGTLPAQATGRRGRSRGRKSRAPKERGNSVASNAGASIPPLISTPAKGKSGVFAQTAEIPPEPSRSAFVLQQSGLGQSPAGVATDPLQPLNQSSLGASQPTYGSSANVAYSVTKGSDLTYIPPTIIDGEPVVIISDEMLEACSPKWGECLVGYYLDKEMPFKLTEAALKHIWGPQLLEVMANDDGCYVFHIPDHEYRKKILDGGPITVAKAPLILQQWRPLMELKRGFHESFDSEANTCSK